MPDSELYDVRRQYDRWRSLAAHVQTKSPRARISTFVKSLMSFGVF
jgi:hypothetical protein